MGSQGLKTSEFALGVLVVLCATVLLGIDKIDSEAWKWAVTSVSGAYVLGRSLVKAADSSGTAKVADFKADLNTLAATPPVSAVLPPPSMSYEELATLLNSTRAELDALRVDLSAPKDP